MRRRSPRGSSSPSGDSYLVISARRGDRNSLIRLISRCERAIAAGVRSGGLPAHTDDHAEATTAALEAIVASFASFDGSGDPCGWMRVVARNKAIALIRSEARQRRISERLTGQTPVEQQDQYFADEGTSAATLAEIVTSSLSPKYRVVVEGYYLDGRSVEELAAELDLSEASVYSRLRRARALALAILREHGHA